MVDPIMPVVAGAVADYITEPAMLANTGLSKAFGWLVGTSSGSGMALQYLFSGLAYIAIIIVAWFIPTIRNVEELLPDHEQLKKTDQPQNVSEHPAAEGGLQPAD
jgi:hypothetical protein